MSGFLGEYKSSADNKGRIRIPSALMKQFGGDHNGRFVVNRGFEACLVIYPHTEWEKITARINKLNTFRKDEREFVRYFYRGATEMAIDGNDRLNIPNHLLDYAGIKGELVIAARQNVFEVWDAKRYDEMMKIDSDRFADLAEKVLGNPENSNPST